MRQGLRPLIQPRQIHYHECLVFGRASAGRHAALSHHSLDLGRSDWAIRVCLEPPYERLVQNQMRCPKPKRHFGRLLRPKGTQLHLGHLRSRPVRHSGNLV
ncbi:hypothetical protein M3J09_002888 [Ascochyta lentis]